MKKFDDAQHDLVVKTKAEMKNEKNQEVHLSHCFQGENEDTCKYGQDDTCPANPKNKVASK